MIQVESNKDLSKLTRFSIGGPADFFCEVKELAELKEAIAWANKNSVPYFVIGEGTNLLVSDMGVHGLVIKINFMDVLIDEANYRVTVGAGFNLLNLISDLNSKGWKGMESMYGIPGNVGAGVYGNVGAYGTEIKDVATKVTIWDGSDVKEFLNSDCGFNYRTSIFKAHKDWIILSVTLQLTPGDAQTLIEQSKSIMSKRLEKYPQGLKCPGSFFKNIKLDQLSSEQKKNVEQYSDKVKGGKLASGILLDAVGAKGMSVGDAKVAEYHGNLIYNAGIAQAQEVLELSKKLKLMVFEKFGIEIEEEVQVLG